MISIEQPAAASRIADSYSSPTMDDATIERKALAYPLVLWCSVFYRRI